MTSSPVPDLHVVLAVAPTEDEWGSRDDRWRSDVFELETALRHRVPDGMRGIVPARDQKGVELIEVVVDLASAGAFTAAVEGLKLWLNKKPDRRTLRLGYRVGNRTGEITADATNIDSGDLARIASEAFKAQP